MKLSEALLKWYDKNLRDLPWRGTRDPYRIWLSEIMLQQTRSETVIRYYERFLQRFPNVSSLAEAPTEEVLKLWEGLGYYSRARNLHKCAQTVAYAGCTFPNTRAELLHLPGIGPYTAAAIASIAFNECVPALDGNQMRVLSRVLACEQMLRTPFDLENEALKMMSRTRPGDYNQALMDLGASICTPKAPHCGQCPLNGFCMAFRMNDQEHYPVRPAPIIKKGSDLTIVLVRTGAGLCVRKRKEKLLEGLYEFVTLDGRVSDTELPAALEALGCSRIRDVRRLPAGKHVFTHLVWHMTGYSVISDTPAAGTHCADADRFKQLPFPSALRIYHDIAGDMLNEVFPNDTAQKQS